MSGFGYVVCDGTVEAVPPHKAPELKGDLVWIHLTTNDDHAKTWLRDQAGLSPFLIEALTAVETRPRCDAVGDGAIVNMRGPTSDELSDSEPLASIRMYAHRGRVISVTRRPLNALMPLRAQVERGEILDPGDLIAGLASAITEELDPIVAELGDSLDDCEERLEEQEAFAMRRKVNRARSQAIGFRRFLLPQRAALEKLATLQGDWLAEDDRLHLNSAADRAARMSEELESMRERAALIHETLTDLRSELIDQRSLLIAVAALVFLPLTFITGLYGMNVKGIPRSEDPQAFWEIFWVCMAISLAITGYFVRRHWFRR